MAVKPSFTMEQYEVLYATARRIWKTRYEHMKKKRGSPEPGGQEAMAAALHIAQQTVSSLLAGKYKPSFAVARAIANLDGQTIDELLGESVLAAPTDEGESAGGRFVNLAACLQFFSQEKAWSPWTIAAARAGVFGMVDLRGSQWAERLDKLEAAMERVRAGK